MNTLKFYPKIIKEEYEKSIKNSGIKATPEEYHNKIILLSTIITVLSLGVFYFLKINLLYSPAVFVVLNIFFYFRINLQASARIKKMEQVFPDVISLMASNLRSGVTIDRAFLLSARPEFDPLDKEILKTGKEIATGKDILYALKTMSQRIDSEKISKVLLLIISGLKAGGNISDLLEETSRNMKEKEIIEKKASSSILMYVIFIFFAVGVGAPILFGLGSVLAEIIINLAARMPDLSATQMDLPFTFNQIAISKNFIVYFAVTFIIVSDLISCLIIGLVNKGNSKSGLKLFIPLLVLSLTIFTVVKTFLSKVLLNAIAPG
jgi:flagellar protein FlaJ